jgi:hypothetical protein
VQLVTDELNKWRTKLVKDECPSGYVVVPRYILPDVVIEQVARSPYPISSLNQLAKITKWPYAEVYGDSLLRALSTIYHEYDARPQVASTQTENRRNREIQRETAAAGMGPAVFRDASCKDVHILHVVFFVLCSLSLFRHTFYF